VVGTVEASARTTEAISRTVEGSGCTLTWSADGRVVTKRYHRLRWTFLGPRHSPFERERRVGLLLRRHPPPLRHARLLAADHRTRTLRYEAIAGEPLGLKFPLEAGTGDVAGLVRLALALRTFRPPAPFLRRFDLARRLDTAVRLGAVRPDVAREVRRQAEDDPPVIVFGHGDVTARNVLRETTSGDLVLVDWEWAARYPRPWDLAFLWFTLVDLPGGREEVEAAVPADDEAWFWRSALLVQLLHLTLFARQPGHPYAAKHERLRDELVERVLALG
jgi:hypothetical protein